MAVHLMDNNNWASSSGSSSSGVYTLGNRFGCTTAQPVTGLRWYRDTTGPNAKKPSRLALYTAGGTLLAEILTHITDSGVIGWQTTGLPATVDLATGTTYIVAMDWPSDEGWRWIARGSLNAPPSGFLWDDEVRAYTTPAGFPATHDNSLAWAVDIETGGMLGGGAGSGDPTLTGDLASWLSNNPLVNSHQSDGIPWLDHMTLGDVLSNTIGILAGLAGVNEDVATLMARIGAFTGTTLAAEIAAIKSLVNAIRGAVIDADNNKVVDLVGELTPLVGAVSRQTAVQRDFVPIPGAGWALSDETDVDRVIAWDVPADAYTLVVTTPPPKPVPVDVAGAQWLPRLGWWAPLNGTQLRERRFIDWTETQLDQWPRRLPGIVVWLEPGTVAHLQAWTYTPT